MTRTWRETRQEVLGRVKRTTDFREAALADFNRGHALAMHRVLASYGSQYAQLYDRLLREPGCGDPKPPAFHGDGLVTTDMVALTRTRASVTRGRGHRRTLGAIAIVAILALSAVLSFATPAFADVAIDSAGPLTSIGATADLNCSVEHRDDNYGEFYGGTACATLVAVGGTLYGPANIPAGGGAGPRTGFTSVDQSTVGGSGSASDPYVIDTTVDAGPLRIRQRDSYVTGFGSYRTDVRVTNTSSERQTVTVYRAGDCYLGDSDVGYGAVEGSAVACQARDVDGGGGSRVEQWAPLTPGSRYMEAGFADVWGHIGRQEEFLNACRCDESIDNGAGLSWRISVEPAESVTVSHLLSFAPRGVAADTNGDGAVRVAVLGDSYISGVGGVDPGEPYDTETDTPRNRCQRTPYSWGPMVAARLGAANSDVLFAACRGATSLDITSRDQQPNSPSGIHGGQAQVTTLRGWTNSMPGDIALLSIGGNDVGFEDIAADCVMGPCLWFAEDRLQSRAFDARYRLVETYRSVLGALRERNEAAELWVANYPSPVSGEVCGSVGYAPGAGRVNGYGIDRAEQVFLRDRFLRTLNESIAWAADAAGAQVLDLSRMAEGHELCSSEPYVNGLSPGPSEGFPFVSARTFHPNKAGYAHIGQEIWSRYALDFGQATRTPLGGSGPIPLLAGSVRLGPDPVALQDAAPPQVLFRPGDTVHLRVVDTPPGNYRLVVRSLPTVVGNITVPESGVQTVSFTVPNSLAPYSHGLTIEDTDGVPLLNTTLHVAAPPGCELLDGEPDQDGDALPDRCDQQTDDGPNADADQDDTQNVEDNCPTTANREQRDTDADGLGDACDPSQGGDPTAGYRTADASSGGPDDDELPPGGGDGGAPSNEDNGDGGAPSNGDGGGPPSSGGGDARLAPAPSGAPAPGPTAIPLGAPTTRFAAKLQVDRATVRRSDQELDVLAPITARASGALGVRFHAAGRIDDLDPAEIDVANGRVRFTRDIRESQADLGTGIVTLTYNGDTDTQPQVVRLRAASQPAELEAGRPIIANGRIKAQGTITDRARGVVHVQVLYDPPGKPTRTLQYKAPIQDGAYELDEALPQDILQGIGQRVGVVHSYTMFTGYFPRRVRGEMDSFQVLGPG